MLISIFPSHVRRSTIRGARRRSCYFLPKLTVFEDRCLLNQAPFQLLNQSVLFGDNYLSPLATIIFPHPRLVGLCGLAERREPERSEGDRSGASPHSPSPR